MHQPRVPQPGVDLPGSGQPGPHQPGVARPRVHRPGDDQRSVYARRWYILGVLVICLLVVILDNTILNVALKTIQQDLGASQSDMEWAVNAYILVFAGLLFTFGVLGDRFGRRRLLLLGMVVFGSTSAICAFSHSAAQLIGFRALMGVGGAMVQPQTLSIITNVFSPQERGRAIGIFAGFSGLAIAIGPVTGGFLLDHFWWGSVFLVNVPFVLVGVGAIALLVPESRDPRPGKIDPAGVLLSIAGLVLLVYGIIKGGQTTDWFGPTVLVPMLSGLGLLAVFVVIERRSTHPSLDISLFRQPAFSAATTAIGLTFFALMGSIFYLAFYLQAVRGYTPFQAGLCLVAVAAATLLAAPRSARLAHRFGPRVVTSAGMALIAVSFGSYFFVQVDTPLWAIECLLFLQGLGMGNVMAPATNTIMGTIPRERAGAGSAVNNTIRQVGGALGVAILGSMLSATYRTNLGTAAEVLPAQYRSGDVAESIGNTLAAIGRAAQAGQRGELSGQSLAVLPTVRAAAHQAFVSAMHVTSIAAATAALVGVAVVLLFMPGRQEIREQRAAEQHRAEAAAGGPR